MKTYSVDLSQRDAEGNILATKRITVNDPQDRGIKIFSKRMTIDESVDNFILWNEWSHPVYMNFADKIKDGSYLFEQCYRTI